MTIKKFAPIKFVWSVYEEALKIIWPNRTTIFRHTLGVIISVIISAGIFAVIDLAFQKLVVFSLKIE